MMSKICFFQHKREAEQLRVDIFKLILLSISQVKILESERERKGKRIIFCQPDYTYLVILHTAALALGDRRLKTSDSCWCPTHLQIVTVFPSNVADKLDNNFLHLPQFFSQCFTYIISSDLHLHPKRGRTSITISIVKIRKSRPRKFN